MAWFTFPLKVQHEVFSLSVSSLPEPPPPPFPLKYISGQIQLNYIASFIDGAVVKRKFSLCLAGDWGTAHTSTSVRAHKYNITPCRKVYDTEPHPYLYAFPILKSRVYLYGSRYHIYFSVRLLFISCTLFMLPECLSVCLYSTRGIVNGKIHGRCGSTQAFSNQAVNFVMECV